MTSVDTPDYLPQAAAIGDANIYTDTVNLGAGATFTSPPISVAAFTQLFAWVQNLQAEPITVEVDWFTDAAATKQVGPQKAFGKTTQTTTYWTETVVAPFLVFKIVNDSAVAIQASVNLAGFAVQFPLSPVQLTGIYVPLSAQSANLGAGATVTPTVILAGPANLYVESDSNVPVAVGLQVWDSGTWDFVDGLTIQTASLAYTKQVDLPLSDWRLHLSAATTTFTSGVMMRTAA